MSNLSPGTRALLRAAKNDAPSRESRSAIWGGVTSGLAPMHLTSQAPPPVPAAAAAAKSALWIGAVPATMKGAFIGALFGSALSIGVATFLLRAKPVAPVQSTAQGSAQAALAGAQGGLAGAQVGMQNTTHVAEPPHRGMQTAPRIQVRLRLQRRSTLRNKSQQHHDPT